MKGLIVTYLLTYGGSIAALFNPFIGLLIYVSFAILMPEYLWPWSVPPGNYSRTIAIALLAGWALHGFGSWRLGRAWAILSALVGFWAWSILSALQASDPTIAWGFIEKLSKIVVPVMIGITLIGSVRQLKQLAWTIILCEGYLALEFNLSYFGGYNRLRFQGYGPMDNNCNAIALVTCLGLSLPMGLQEKVGWRKALALGLSALIIHAILFSFSRGGMLGLGLTGLTIFLLLPKQPKHYLGAVLGLMLVLHLAGSEVIERFSQTFADKHGHREASAQSRLDLWANCLDVMKKRPILGAGPDHWPLLASSYGWREGKEAHTLWLQVGAEVGIPGLALLVAYYALCAVRLYPLARGSIPIPDPWFSEASRMVIASLVGFAFTAQFVSIKVLEHPYYVVMIGAGLLKLSTGPALADQTVLVIHRTAEAHHSTLAQPTRGS